MHQAKLVDANKFSVAGFILGQASFRQEVPTRLAIQGRRMKSARQKRRFRLLGIGASTIAWPSDRIAVQNGQSLGFV